MHLCNEDDGVTLKLSTRLPIVKEILQDQVAQIKTALHGQGLHIDKCHVVAAHEAYQRPLFKGQEEAAEGLLFSHKTLLVNGPPQGLFGEGENAPFPFHGPLLERGADGLVPLKQVPPRPLETQILNQVVDKAVLTIRKGQNEMRIDLKPPALGHLRMHILTEKDLVTLRISTHVPMVKEILEGHIDQLRIALQDHGLEIEKFDVLVSHDSHEHARSHQNGHFKSPETTYHEQREGDNGLANVDEETLESETNGTDAAVIDFFA
ncbi:MAG: flagellar hook-length control protein FliK [Thermodesulfobacteriota bacterium]|nr:flagellar hook-length control protein FliK [Thermodesulfobacteriota bacterium]